MKQFEVNFDGLVGPTHNYAGLSYGNVASLNNASAESSPKQAAKQGLKKMKALADLGMIQGVLAPQARPDVDALRRLGFSGSDAKRCYCRTQCRYSRWHCAFHPRQLDQQIPPLIRASGHGQYS